MYVKSHRQHLTTYPHACSISNIHFKLFIMLCNISIRHRWLHAVTNEYQSNSVVKCIKDVILTHNKPPTSLIQLCRSVTTTCIINNINSTSQSQSQQSKRAPSYNRKSSSHRIFQDRVRLQVTGGTGGSGCSSYLRSRDGKLTPNGGNGGAGGSVYIQSTDKIQTLDYTTYHITANNGQAGQSSDCNGKNGSDVTINVPAGTVLHRIDSKDEITNQYNTTQLYDFIHSNQSYCIAKGGTGGYGNKSHKRAYRRSTSFSSTGQPGESCNILLELKTLADIGLVGYPNAGKSSLLGCISRAKPAVANYPFTTLQPYVGIVEVNDIYMSQFSLADIPGLINGAHLNRGLGHAFLRHIERCKVMCYVIDVSSSDNRDPLEDYITLKTELELYKPELIYRPSVIYCNKIDSKPKTCQNNIERIKEYTLYQMPVISGSAQTGKNMKELIDTLYSTLQHSNKLSLKQQISRDDIYNDNEQHVTLQHSKQQLRASM